MDPKPFRCVYDPELSKSKSQGKKPIFVRAQPEVNVTDPRRHGAKGIGKRSVPTETLPPPDFAPRRSKPVITRCLITGVGPLVTRSRLSDAMRQFGTVEDCQIVFSKITGASLGLGWAKFSSSDVDAVTNLIESNKAGQLELESQGKRGLFVKYDNDGLLLAQAERDAERAAQSLFTESTKTHLDSPNTPSREARGPQLVELRNLTPPQVTQWYNKILGTRANYVLIRDIFLSVQDYNSDDIARVFKGFPFTKIAINKSGFYICFENEENTVDCYLKMHRKPLFGSPIKLMITLSGERYRYDEVVAKSQQQQRSRRDSNGNANGNGNGYGNGYAYANGNSLASTKTLRPGHSPLDIAINDAASQILTELGPQMRNMTWNKLMSDFVLSIAADELERAKAKTNTDTANGSQDSAEPECNDSDTAASADSRDDTPSGTSTIQSIGVGFGVGLGARRGGITGMAPRAVRGFSPYSQLTALKMRKRYAPDTAAPSTSSASAGPAPKKPKTMTIASAAPKGFLRAPLKQEGDNLVPTMHDLKPSNAVKEEEDESKMDVDATPEIESGTDYSESEEEEEEEEEEAESPEEDDEVVGVATTVEALSTKFPNMKLPQGYFDILKIVRSKQDLMVLRDELAKATVPKLSEEEVLEKYEADNCPKLIPDPGVDWPPVSQKRPFRTSPYRHRTDDERWTYLPNAGPGVPNEIVRSYTDRPLYQGYVEPDEEEEERTATRSINVSRSAFGVNAELFADDNLSKNAKDTRLARSAIHDWGLYADEPIPANEFVIEYVGDILRDEYSEIRERNYDMEGIDSTYLFRLDNGTVIDATKRGNGARFINHSCDPNCVAQVFDHEGTKRVVLFSVKDIDPDEELTFDYNFVKSQDEDGRVRCHCGASNCRGWLM